MPDQPEKLDLTSASIPDAQRAKLRELFPEVFTESGKIDLDRLKRTLGETVDAGKERFGLTWPGKADCFKTIQQASTATLRPTRVESVNFDATGNAIIEGDNLEVLKLLQKSYLSKVKMIYIDPPYNTGNDFIYPDNYSESLDTYLRYTGQVDSEGRKYGANTEADGRFHSKWLNMMYPRLFLARNLLRSDGVIFISIGEEELTNLVSLMNEIFGEENRLTIISRLQKRGGNKGNYFNPVMDYVLAYSKSIISLPFFTETVDEDIYTKTETEGPRAGAKYAEVVIYMPNLDYRPNQRYYVDAPDGSRVIPPEGKSFRWSPHRFDEEKRKGNVVCKASKNSKLIDENGAQAKWIVYQKRFLTDTLTDETARPNNFFEDFQNMLGSKELEELGIPFDYPKPSLLVRKLIFISKCRGDDIVLDLFAGSGSTAHAVLDSNAEDNGSRKFILVQLPEPIAREGYDTVAEITKERVRRVIKKLNDEDVGKLTLTDGTITDRGFKVFKLQGSNFKAWNSDVAKETAALTQQLEMHVQHIVDGRTPEDLLFEILLKSGFPLNTPIETLSLAGKAVYAVEQGAMLVCLDSELTPAVIQAMADRQPVRVICLDAGFVGNDQLKTNAVQQMRARGVTKFQTV